MKTKLLTAMAAAALLFVGCQREDISPNQNNSISAVPATGSSSTSVSSPCEQEFELMAGQHINAGNITVTNDDDFIYVTYNTENGWVLNETHLYVGDPSGIPTNGAGNPTIGLFPYNDAHNGATSYTLTIPIDPNLECYAVAAHASVSLIDGNGNVVQSETAWSNGDQINNGGSWAMYSEYCLTDCCVYEVVDYDYFAGQNINVGNLSVTNDDQNLYVTFNFTGNWYTQQTHLYVGPASGMPINNANIPIPGQFPYATTHNPMTQSYTYTIPLANLDPCYVIAAHSEMVETDGNGNVISTETGWSYGTEFPNSPRWGWYSEYCTQICN